MVDLAIRTFDGSARKQAVPSSLNLRPSRSTQSSPQAISVRGSRESRSPSPMMLKARTVSMINPPGKSDTHGAWANNSLPSFRIAPHEGMGGCTPTPRYESAYSIRIAYEMQTAVWTITGDTTVGRI